MSCIPLKSLEELVTWPNKKTLSREYRRKQTKPISAGLKPRLVQTNWTGRKNSEANSLQKDGRT